MPVLVASDAATRGLDVEGVTAVVNYDAPVYTKTYVHRAGRTARAGRAGEVYTMLRKEDVKHFKEMLRKADNNYVRDCDVSREEMDAYKETVTAVLRCAEWRSAGWDCRCASIGVTWRGVPPSQSHAAGEGGRGREGGGRRCARAVGTAASRARVDCCGKWLGRLGFEDARSFKRTWAEGSLPS